MRRNNFALGLTLLGMVALAVSGCVSSKVNNSKLVIGMECAYQPFNWSQNSANTNTLPIDGTSEHADGYDIAVAKFLAEDLGKEVIIKRIGWSDLIPSLQKGSINMILAGMSSTAERRQTIDFTDPYLQSDLAFLMRAENIPEDNSPNNPLDYQGLKDLFRGHSLICQSGVFGEDVIDDYFGEPTLNITHSAPQSTYPLAAIDVQNGISFAMPAELPVVEAMANLEGLGVLYVDYSFLEAGDLEGLSVNIGIKKGNTELLDELNGSLTKLTQEQRSEMMGQASLRSQG
jgi:ABC-type amino acid transport substrate-binding protein